MHDGRVSYLNVSYKPVSHMATYIATYIATSHGRAYREKETPIGLMRQDEVVILLLLNLVLVEP